MFSIRLSSDAELAFAADTSTEVWDMARAQYFVVKHEGNWKIKHNGEHHGPYSNQATAIKYAVDAAHKAGQGGHDAQVLVQGLDSKFRTEWTYGHDPYPPKG
jgi:hypothetical protein